MRNQCIYNHHVLQQVLFCITTWFFKSLKCWYYARTPFTVYIPSGIRFVLRCAELLIRVFERKHQQKQGHKEKNPSVILLCSIKASVCEKKVEEEESLSVSTMMTFSCPLLRPRFGGLHSELCLSIKHFFNKQCHIR